ncbi:TonB-dependent receptor plug domain-containing protein [Kistimonas asteriae]|uniref:TonB-dependent receptor plug domain-containing protein n=1 Tax=Kistimonas asteriae TaxID=517724 RepID=UPI001BA72307|nr:TonB-dependent receptor plug domain-containing protein [Kistimonas asteriae]
MTTFNKTGLAVALCSLFTTSAAIGEDDFLDMSLEELVSLEVTSVSKKSQSIMESAAAVYAITQEDIRRSGAKTIPDLLRMVPGLQVSKINGNAWSVSSRGFNSVFSNKLLVLIDGRSVYTPLYSGVTWETNDVMLADIDRIEVIRGPGAALWGSNAVNGVINIMTRSAAETQGTYVEVGAGSYEQGFGSVRYGGQLGENANYRVYYKYSDRDHQKTLNSTLAQEYSNIGLDDAPEASDGWNMNQTGFRIDWDRTAEDLFTFQGDLYKGHIRPAVKTFDRTTGTGTFVSSSNRQFGANALGRWTHTLSADSEAITQVYYDRYENSDVRAPRHRDTWDIDFHHRFPLTENQEIIWGLGYRKVDNKVYASEFVDFDPSSRTTELYSAFIQDEITLVPDRWRMTLSSRFENNEFTGDEIQPNARIIFTPDAEQSFWAAISKSVRTPSIVEVDSQVYGFEERGPNTFVAFAGNDDIKSETLFSYELGYRRIFSEALTIDTTIFLNHYKNLAATNQGTCEELGMTDISGIIFQPSPLCQPTFNALAPIYFPVNIDNVMEGDAYGFEIAADWQVQDNWKLKLSYGFLQMDLHSTDNNAVTTAIEPIFETVTAEHNMSLMSRHNFSDNWELDLWLRYQDNVQGVSIPSFVTADIRVAKQVGDFEFAIVGQNLLDSQHPEYLDGFTGIATTEVPRSIYGQVSWQY